MASVGFAALMTTSAAAAAEPTTAPTDQRADQDQAVDTTEPDILVTANKRSENVQDVASSVSVISGAQLEARKLEQLSDYVAFIPGVTANTLGSPGQSALTIRGISPLSAGSKVATYIDETPLGSSGIWAQAGGLTLDLLPFDLDRLELLRGPQGTLYGASSMGGLLKYVLTTPSTTKLAVDLAADTGIVKSANTAAGTFQGHVNVPVIADVLGISASAFYKYSPGYIDNAYTGEKNTNSAKQYGGRVAAFLRAAPNLTLKLNAMWQTTDSRDDAAVSFAAPTVGASSTTSPQIISGGKGFGDLTESEAFRAAFKSTVNFYSGTVNWDVGPVNVVSATSWSKYDVSRLANRSLSYGTYLPAFGLPEGLMLGSTTLNTKKFTQELRVSSPQSNTIAWQLGGFYTAEDQQNVQIEDAFTKAYVPIAALAPNASYLTIPTTYREYAAFGDVTWTISPKFDVSGGVRYSTNKQVFQLSARGALVGAPQTTLTKLPTIRSREDNTTWLGSARYHFTKDIMAFVRVASGYAPGGANTPYPGVPQATVGSETLISYEAGIKSEFLNRRALINVSVFHIDWSNIQLAARLGAVGYTANGGSARSDGVELSSRFTPIHGLNLGFNAAYTDAKLTSLNPKVTTAFIVDQKLQSVPDWALSGTLDYNWRLSRDWSASLGSSVRWVDRELGAQPAAGTPIFILPAYAVLDVTASISKGPYTFRIYAKNLTDSRGYSSGSTYPDRVGAIRQIDYYVIQPRSAGIGVAARF